MVKLDTGTNTTLEKAISPSVMDMIWFDLFIIPELKYTIMGLRLKAKLDLNNRVSILSSFIDIDYLFRCQKA